jgi:hypothetical protein
MYGWPAAGFVGGKGNGRKGRGDREEKNVPLYLALLHTCNIFSPHAIIVQYGEKS